MSNKNKELQGYNDEVKSLTRQLMLSKEGKKRKCDHKPSNNGRIMGIHDSKIHVPQKNNLPETTVICTNCERFFESNAYLPEDGDAGIYMFTSMVEQVKLNAHLNEEDKKTIENVYDAIDTISSFLTYYNNMVDKLANGNNNNKRVKTHNKGHMGLNPNMFGGRGY